MATIVTLATRRSHYSAKDAAAESMTIGELIAYLQDNFDEDTKIIFSNDNGYTYGVIKEYQIDEMQEED